MYTWVAVYKDGTHLAQFEQDGETEHSSEEIRRDQLDRLTLLWHDGSPFFTQYFDEGRRPIYRRRIECPPVGDPVVCHMIGWQATVAGQNVQHISYVFEDGRIAVAGEFREEHPWFYSPSWTGREMDVVGKASG